MAPYKDKCREAMKLFIIHRRGGPAGETHAPSGGYLPDIYIRSVSAGYPARWMGDYFLI